MEQRVPGAQGVQNVLPQPTAMLSEEHVLHASQLPSMYIPGEHRQSVLSLDPMAYAGHGWHAVAPAVGANAADTTLPFR